MVETGTRRGLLEELDHHTGPVQCPVGKSVAAHTRFRAPYVNTDGLRFCVYSRSVFTGLGKVLGLVQDIEIGEVGNS
jgi:hypothetical protein